MIRRLLFIGVIGLLGFWIIGLFGEAQETKDRAVQELTAQAQPETKVEEAATPTMKEGNVTLDFKDADIQNVLRVLSYKSGINIIASKEVAGTVTMRLVDVPWEQALEVILKTSGFAYEREGNIITVSTVDVMKERREKEKELTEIEPVTTKVFTLQFLDASDAKKLLEPQLSPQGKISVLEVTGQKGWEFGAVKVGGEMEAGKERRVREAARSRALVITDTPSYLERIARVIKEIDIKPTQVLIEARIMEVNRDVLKDIGLEFQTISAATGTVGAVSVGEAHREGRITASHWTMVPPSVFGPKATALTAANTGLGLLYRRLTGKQFEIYISALEEDVRTNVLSAPRILTLSGQEAAILVGTKWPIIESSVSGTSGTATYSLAWYQDIGIQLYVVPQVSGDEKFINMIVHPVISEKTDEVSPGTLIGVTRYPVLSTREVETQIIMGNGETIVIGGLLKDVKKKSKIGIPILSDIPIVGAIFSRRTTDIEKIDLLIFITARVVKPGEISEQEMAMIQKAQEVGQPDISPEESPAKKEEKKEKVKPEGYTKGNKGFFKKK
ncbi:MAG: type IV pilus secretin PilQ [Candidatus Omnitrophota bacterium]